jgi:hypothetical protein
MPRRKITEPIRRRIEELSEGGLSQQAIASKLRKEGVSVTQRGVANALSSPPEPTRTSKAPKTSSRKFAPLPKLPDDASVAARVLWEELKVTRERIRALPPGAETATQHATLSRVLLGQLKQLDEMIPPAPPDPSKDPMNIAARQMVHAHVLRAIEAVEARDGRLCPRCREELERG